MSASSTTVFRPAVAAVPVSTRRRARLATAAVASTAALVLWAIVEYGFGLDLRSPAFGSGEVADVGAAHVLVASLAGSLLGWASLATLERLSARAARLWAAGAVVALLVSLGGPLGGTGIGAGNRAVLAAMHVVVAVIAIAGLYRTSPRRGAARA